MNKVAAVGEARERAPEGPGEEVIDNSTVALRNIINVLQVYFDTFSHLNTGEDNPAKGHTPSQSLETKYDFFFLNNIVTTRKHVQIYFT